MPDIFDTYEQKHLQGVARVNRQIKSIYKNAINRISLQVKTIRINGKQFELSKNPAIKKIVEREMAIMQKEIYTAVVNSIESSWSMSNEKNDLLIDQRVIRKAIPKNIATILYDPNREAMKQFISRKEKGLNLSERVWNSLDPFRNEVEQTIGLGISEGRAAASLATDLQKNLVEPERLFRRVRGEYGKLKLSAAAREYSPGQGVYRSSYKNALRVARTETNIAYRSSDHERWNKMPFIKGIEVRLSNNHKIFDICDTLAGMYPKEFKFTGWHPQCLCHAVPIIMDDEEYNKIEDQLLAGEEIRVPKKGLVSKPPAAFANYVKANEDRIAGWKNKPYWLKDNGQYIK